MLASAAVHAKAFALLAHQAKNNFIYQRKLRETAVFFLYIKYNRDLSFISAGFLGEVGLSFWQIAFLTDWESAVSNESLKDKKYANENEQVAIY